MLYHKYIYSAKFADAAVTRHRLESRQGVRLADEKKEELDELVTRLVKKGQPLTHIYAEHENEMPVCLRTLYNYIDEGALSIKNIDLRRKTGDNELEALRIIECLKKSGLEIKDIKQFFIWVSEGSSSYEKRKELFETRKSAVETEIQELQKTLSLLKFKCWYYETAMKDGNEDAINAMLPDKLPKNIQKLYDKGHE